MQRQMQQRTAKKRQGSESSKQKMLTKLPEATSDWLIGCGLEAFVHQITWNSQFVAERLGWPDQAFRIASCGVVAMANSPGIPVGTQFTRTMFVAAATSPDLEQRSGITTEPVSPLRSRQALSKLQATL